MANLAAQVGMGGPAVINPMGLNTIEEIFQAAANGQIAQAVFNGPFIQMSWLLVEQIRNGVLPPGIICAAETGIQVLRNADLWVRSDLQGRNIHPYVEIGAALALLPPFGIEAINVEGVRFVMLRTGESVGKFENNCGEESHVVLKLGGGTAAIADGQMQSYVPGGAFRRLYKRTAKLRFFTCDCHGQGGNGAWALPGGLHAGAGAIIAHAARAPHDACCVCAAPRFGKWHNGYEAVGAL